MPVRSLEIFEKPKKNPDLEKDKWTTEAGLPTTNTRQNINYGPAPLAL